MENTQSAIAKLNERLISLQDQYEQTIYQLESMGLHIPEKLNNPFRNYEASYMHEIEKEIKEKREFLYMIDKATHPQVFQEGLENAISTRECKINSV